ncbi:DNA-binding response regulator [Siphonobacter sp. SORGH_AS_0500]|uniref:LytR/AlgR family response regulator transcription factor n=1 Tax=Siphonobacter sp. SORGH_AS_0500 TaxID=1864824 RepID=UPI000CAF36B3|nr:LytTR family DNA-binding domain-containing protein [Siphonobacter sp. SORGH_AS_0500]PKK35097.1 DNA-binding response regulator [Siphonobacter sp. SORGH_AS_0500]
MNRLRIVIIEDEAVTARNLAHLLRAIEAKVHIMALLPSIDEAIDWFKENPAEYDLIFSDIRLTDGPSFAIFEQIPIDRPVIFVTAYDNYTIEAFKNQGIDYILKPFDEEELRRALSKFYKLVHAVESMAGQLKRPVLSDLFHQSAKFYRKSFLINYRNKLIPIESAQIAWFYTSNEVVYLQTMHNQQFTSEETLEQLEQQLDPELFFRANRQYIVNRRSIKEVEYYFNGRLLVKLEPSAPEHVLISKARATSFKNWMNY